MTSYDDPSILDEHELWRSIHPIKDWVKTLPDGTQRITSAAFKDSTREISVDLAVCTTVERVKARFPERGIAALPAAIPRQHLYSVTSNAQKDNPAHALILQPSFLSSGAVRRAAQAMASAANEKWFYRPTNWEVVK